MKIEKLKESLLYEKVFSVIISLMLVVMAFVIIFLSGGPLITMYQGMSTIFYILILIALLMIYIRVSEIKTKEVKK